jgi:squalene-hopene/tetraprenyl-beta-curcumene cyclase
MTLAPAAALAALLPLLPVSPPPATPPATPPAEAGPPVYEPPSRPLDERVDPEKITELDPPPLPERVILPKPPEFRIAATAAELPIDEATYRRAVESIDRGIAFLVAGQETAGGWMSDVRAAPTDQPEVQSPVAVAVTAMIVKALVQAGPDAVDPTAVGRAVSFIRAARNDDGGFGGGGLESYVTAAVTSALASLEDDDAVGDALRDAVGWLQVMQWDQGEGLAARQDWFGGAGYGNRQRPDLSNTQMMLDALYDAGMSPDEPAFQRALAFISRSQNLKAANPAPWAGDDGGFVYTPANGGESFASQAAGEGRYGELIPAGEPRSLRSYGSMTYAGFKSMLYAGLSPDDVRVRAAFDWIRRHWTFQENPGLGDQGLYYYYHTMARALAVAQQEEIEDVEGRRHNWRAELVDAIVSRQNADGSWRNEADRWLEGHPVLATVYAVLSLQEALKPVLRAN